MRRPLFGSIASAALGSRCDESRAQRVDAGLRQLRLQPGPHHGVGGRDLEPVEGRAKVQTRPADEDRDAPSRADAGDVGTRMTLVRRDTRLLADVQDVQLVVRDPAPLGE